MVAFTFHARLQMGERNISLEAAENVIRSPQQRIAGHSGRAIYQSRYFDTIEEKEMILRVAVERQGDNLTVISAYQTSRLRKYWVEEGI